VGAPVAVPEGPPPPPPDDTGELIVEGSACSRRGGARERHGGAGRRDRGAPEPSMKRKWGFSSLRWAALPPCVFDLKGLMLTLVFPVRRVTPTIPALALAKVLKSEAFVPTRRRSPRAPPVSATATGEPPHDMAMARSRSGKGRWRRRQRRRQPRWRRHRRHPYPPRATRRWWTLLTTTPHPLGGANGGTSPHQPLSAHRGCQ
jgi:hypothetical protein